MSQASLTRATVVTGGTVPQNQAAMRFAFYDATGAALNVPKKGTAIADNGTFTSAVAAGSAPTKAEFDALRADALALRTTVNDLLAVLRTAGVIASS